VKLSVRITASYLCFVGYWGNFRFLLSTMSPENLKQIGVTHQVRIYIYHYPRRAWHRRHMEEPLTGSTQSGTRIQNRENAQRWMGEQAGKRKKGRIKQPSNGWMHIAFPTLTRSTGLPDMRCRYRGIVKILHLWRDFGGNT
jgi:hypothetical protein